MNQFRLILLAVTLAALCCAVPASAQNISIVSGNGQAVCFGCTDGSPFSFRQLVVRVTDASGNPINGAQVDWSALGSVFVTLQGSTFTNSSGIAVNNLFVQNGFNPSAFQSFQQYNVTATSGGATVTFFETVGYPDAPTTGSFPQNPIRIYSINVPVGTALSGQAGTVASTSLQLGITDSHGKPIPNINMFLESDGTGPTAQCVTDPNAGPNMVLSNAQGIVTCTPIFGNVPGSGKVNLLVGGAPPLDPTDSTQTSQAYWRTFIPLSLTVTPGVAGSIKIVSGNNQSANPGQSLPTPLQVEVDSASGSPLAGQSVTWSVTPASAASLVNSVGTTDANGRATTGLSISGGAAAGAITVTARLGSDASKSTNFTVQVVPAVTITNFQIVSGNNQSAAVSTAFAQPLVVQVTTSSGSPANIPVQFVSNGSISLSTTSASTDANGRASVNVTAGSVTGAASVTANVSSSTGFSSQTFQLTVLPPAPLITAANFVNGADQQANSLSPCSIGAVVASNTALSVPNASPTFPGLPLANSSVKLTINNVGAPILGVSTLANGQQQILFQVPCEVTPGSSVPATLNLGGGTTNVNLQIQAASPGIYQQINSDNVSRAVVVRPDGTFATQQNPARRGETVVVYVTGLGATVPSVGTGSVPVPGSVATVQGTVVVGMAGQGVQVNSAKLAQDLVGVYTVSFQIPGVNDIGTGDNLSISVALIPQGSSTAIYSATTKIPVQ